MTKPNNSIYVHEVTKYFFGAKEFNELVNTSFPTLPLLEDYVFHAFKSLSQRNINRLPGYKSLTNDKKRDILLENLTREFLRTDIARLSELGLTDNKARAFVEKCINGLNKAHTQYKKEIQTTPFYKLCEILQKEKSSPEKDGKIHRWIYSLITEGDFYFILLAENISGVNSPERNKIIPGGDPKKLFEEILLREKENYEQSAGLIRKITGQERTISKTAEELSAEKTEKSNLELKLKESEREKSRLAQELKAHKNSDNSLEINGLRRKVTELSEQLSERKKSEEVSLRLAESYLKDAERNREVVKKILEVFQEDYDIPEIPGMKERFEQRFAEVNLDYELISALVMGGFKRAKFRGESYTRRRHIYRNTLGKLSDKSKILQLGSLIENFIKQNVILSWPKQENPLSINVNTKEIECAPLREYIFEVLASEKDLRSNK